MVMEHLDGRDLDAEKKARHPLPIAELVDLLLQALEAIGEAHRAGIVHRDLKPANLFLSRDAHGGVRVKVLDFGISKLASELARGEGSNLTTTSTMLGTPLYMSPEQMRSTRDVDAKSDIWSLGVILFELVTGDRPFKGDAITELAIKVITEPTPPVVRSGDLPDGLDRVIHRCLEKEPHQRYANVAELAMALAPFGGPGASDQAMRVARSCGEASPPPASSAVTAGHPQPGATTPSPETGAPWTGGSAPRPKGLSVTLAVVALAAIGGIVFLAARKQGEDKLDGHVASAAPEPSHTDPATAAPVAPSAAPSTISFSSSAPAPSSTSTARSTVAPPPRASATDTAATSVPPAQPSTTAAAPKRSADPFGPGRK
jgi:serine/threonine-protein kinase